MKEERTALGNFAMFILTAIGVLGGIAMLFLYVIFKAVIPNEALRDRSMSIPIVLVIVSVIATVLIWYIPWNAFRKNDPDRMKGIVIFAVIASIVLCLGMTGVYFMPSGIASDLQIKGVGIYALANAAIIMINSIIILLELTKRHEKNMKNAWCVVALFEVISLIINNLAPINAGRTMHTVTVIGSLVTGLAITLLAYWIVAQEKFYRTRD
ncbi:MAG: hypothetical protein K6G69_04005 [Lachnospiraceae bacterium]|nr:hypothetical protein [Lachnospiraceae bacterium]